MRRITLQMHSRLPSIMAAASLGLAVLWMAGGLGEPLARNPVLVAMFFGLFVGNVLHCPDALRPGLDFTKRYLLGVAVVLVGYRITGGLLIAVGSAVCGATAILSVAAMTCAKEAHAGIAITLITLSGTLALLLYPVAFLGAWLSALDERLYGIFVGSSIYELAQVYGASFTVSEGALNTASLVKLSKVLMLLTLLLGLGLWRRRQDAAAQLPPTRCPWFIAGVVVVVAFKSNVTLHPHVRRLILTLDQFPIIMVMATLGLTTRLSTFAGQ